MCIRMKMKDVFNPCGGEILKRRNFTLSEKYEDGETLNSISGSRSRAGKPTLKELH